MRFVVTTSGRAARPRLDRARIATETLQTLKSKTSRLPAIRGIASHGFRIVELSREPDPVASARHSRRDGTASSSDRRTSAGRRRRTEPRRGTGASRSSPGSPKRRPRRRRPRQRALPGPRPPKSRPPITAPAMAPPAGLPSVCCTTSCTASTRPGRAHWPFAAFGSVQVVGRRVRRRARRQPDCERQGQATNCCPDALHSHNIMHLAYP